MSQHTVLELLPLARTCAQQAGKLILETYHSGNYQSFQKADESPVTCADLAAHELIERLLSESTPSIPIMSEEQDHVPLAQRKDWQRYWLVDPIDGTQEFVSKTGDFAVNIALIENNQPTLGVIHWPTTGKTYYAARGHGAWCVDQTSTRKIGVRQLHQHALEQQKIILAVSRVQPLAGVMKNLNSDFDYQTMARGSCSLKACAIAEGIADTYIRLGVTGEWDAGAAQCIVSEAGGKLLDMQFNPLTYNQREQLSNPDFLIVGDQSVDWQHIIKPVSHN